MELSLRPAKLIRESYQLLRRRHCSLGATVFRQASSPTPGGKRVALLLRWTDARINFVIRAQRVFLKRNDVRIPPPLEFVSCSVSSTVSY